MSFLTNFIANLGLTRSKKQLTLVELLDENQPYKEFHRIQDNELSNLNDDEKILPRIQGALLGLAVGDALGASVEFRPHSYLKQHPVTDMQGGGTWGLKAGQWTDDTSMALCLAASLIVKGGFDGYDQLVRYKWWYRKGYLSSTGTCFDIGNATRDAIIKFENLQRQCAKQLGLSSLESSFDRPNEEIHSQINFNINCGDKEAAGNGALMRLAPIPLFYHCSKVEAIHKAACSATLTHGDKKASDACRFYAALIWNAIHGESKEKLLDPKNYRNDFKPSLHPDVMKIVEGSYKDKKGYDDGIRGKGFILDALEAALWAFDNDDNSFEKGALAAVNLGDDTDTTAAIYGQLAGAVYGIEGIPERWRNLSFEREFIITLANGLFIRGKHFNHPKRKCASIETIEVDVHPPKSKRNLPGKSAL
ncbi:hypothetical protein I4U23_014370 [Adineta vaga]|nr:hypothetical protein I4U23_014370 [Adineta vaga]